MTDNIPICHHVSKSNIVSGNTIYDNGILLFQTLFKVLKLKAYTQVLFLLNLLQTKIEYWNMINQELSNRF